MDGADRMSLLRRAYRPAPDEEETDDGDEDSWSAWFSGCLQIGYVASGCHEKCAWCTGSYLEEDDEEPPVYWLADSQRDSRARL